MDYRYPIISGTATITVTAADHASFILESTEVERNVSNAISFDHLVSFSPATRSFDFETVSAGGYSGAFSILKTIGEAHYFLSRINIAPPSGSPIPVVWAYNPGGESFYSIDEAFILIARQNDAHFHKSIIAHEYGHYVMFHNLPHNRSC